MTSSDVSVIPEPAEWTLYAKCVGMPSDFFFPTRTGKVPASSLAFCTGCPVQRDCLEDALAHPPFNDRGDDGEETIAHDWGVWGGTTLNERNGIRAGCDHPARHIPFADLAHLASVRSRTHLELVNQ